MTRPIACAASFIVAAAVALSCSSRPSPQDGGAGGGGDGSGGGGGGGGASPRTWVFTVDPDGGTFVAGAMTLEIPPGALATTTDIRVLEDIAAQVEGATLTSPVYVFEPAGLAFDDAVHVVAEVSDRSFGSFFWSRADGVGEERIGFVVDGVGEGYVRHFSRGYTTTGACIDPEGPGRSRCECGATDWQGGLLDKAPPGGFDAGCGSDWPPPGTKWSGVNGQPCSGVAKRDVTKWSCFCDTPDGGDICLVPWRTIPSQACEPGLKAFDGGDVVFDASVAIDAPSSRCSGSRLINGMNVMATGRLNRCQPVVLEQEWRQLPGILVLCSDTNPALPMGLSLCPPGAGQKERISQACAEALSAATEVDGGRRACPGLSAQQTAVLGTRVGAHIENELFSSPPDNLTQVNVPGASKKNCGKAGAHPGRPDLIRVISRTATEVVIQIGDVKPLTTGGLAKGADDIYGCYQDQAADAGARCASMAGLSPEEAQFCNALGANGKTVRVDKMGGVGFSPQEFCGPPTTDGGSPQRYVAYQCQPGVTAYRCAP